jgi:outer membrane protein TolC
MRRSPRPRWALFVSVSALTGLPARAAEHPLDPLLRAAWAQDPSIAQALAGAEAQGGAVGTARAALLPRVQASGGYTRNAFAAEITQPGETDPIVITPLDQWDATLRLDLPLVDAGAWAELASARACADSATATAEAQVRAALRATVEAAWSVETARAALAAAEAAEATQQALAARAAARAREGTAAAADAAQAAADHAAATAATATAAADLDAAARALEARTGRRAPDAPLAARPLPDGDLAAAAQARPELRAARDTLRCRTAAQGAARADLAPTLGAFAQERFTNATGFIGEVAVWSAGAQFAWSPVEGGRRAAALGTAAAERRAAEAALAAQTRAAEDALADARARVAPATAAAAAARAQAAAAATTAADAAARLQAGTGSAADAARAVEAARRAAVEAARAEARAALAVEDLRLAAGLPLFAPPEGR